MTRYLLSVHTASGGPTTPVNDVQMREGYARINTLEDEMRSAGALVFSGRLADPSTASVVRTSEGGMLTTDGPFIEAKEAIGGFYIVQADGDDAALEWASKTSMCIGMPIEVRPFVDSRGA